MTAGVKVTFDTSGIEHSLEILGRRAGAVPLGTLAEALKEGIDDVIQAQGAVGGGSTWDPMAPGTVKRHPRRAGGQLLQATGLLANIQTRTGSDFVEASSPAKYAGYHVVGTKVMPRRDFLAIDVARVLDSMGDVAIEEIRR